MENIFVFPSVLEENYRNFEKVADEFLEGIKICDFNSKDYIIGKLALKEGVSPHKFLNSSSEDIDYQILSLTALLIATQGEYSKFVVTTGFPFSTYQAFRMGTANFLNGNKSINFDTRPIGGKSNEVVDFSVSEVEVMTEVEGAIKYIRDGELKEKNNFLLASIGYGTFELALSRPEGLVYRTAASTNGIIYAIKLLEAELQKTYYTSLHTDQQLERAFQRGNIVINRKKIDLFDLRNKVLESYYNEVISPSIRRNITDEDFYDVEKIYLVGGGALFHQLVELFNKEFKDILNVVVVPSPNLAASRGYCLKSVEVGRERITTLEDRSSYACVGLDLGNNNTVVTVNSKF